MHHGHLERSTSTPSTRAALRASQCHTCELEKFTKRTEPVQEKPAWRGTLQNSKPTHRHCGRSGQHTGHHELVASRSPQSLLQRHPVLPAHSSPSHCQRAQALRRFGLRHRVWKVFPSSADHLPHYHHGLRDLHFPFACHCGPQRTSAICQH